MNRITSLFQRKSNNILSVYFTAGYPSLDDTATIIRSLAGSGVDMIEAGMPFSDPVADGPVIQRSSEAALHNGISLKHYFRQVGEAGKDLDIPVLFMGYLNPVVRYGIENFCASCRQAGIDGVILPDLPVDIYKKEIKPVFDKAGLKMIFLIAPQTPEERIRELDEASTGFLYMVASASTTGAKKSIKKKQEAYFTRVKNMKLRNPLIIGFGISSHETFTRACRYANGAIIGSAYINTLKKSTDIASDTRDFVRNILGSAE